MEHDEFLQVIRSPFHFATCDAVLRGCKIVDRSKPLQWRRLSKKVRSPLGPLCEGAPPAGGGGENCTAARNISGYGKVLSLRHFGAPLPLWRKRHLPRIGGVCLAEGDKKKEPRGALFYINALRRYFLFSCTPHLLPAAEPGPRRCRQATRHRP